MKGQNIKKVVFCINKIDKTNYRKNKNKLKVAVIFEGIYQSLMIFTRKVKNTIFAKIARF